MVAGDAVDYELEWPRAEQGHARHHKSRCKDREKEPAVRFEQLSNQADQGSTPLCDLTVSQDISNGHCHLAVRADPPGPQPMFAGRPLTGWVAAARKWCRNAFAALRIGVGVGDSATRARAVPRPSPAARRPRPAAVAAAGGADPPCGDGSR